jgi:hypothetical protein
MTLCDPDGNIFTLNARGKVGPKMRFENAYESIPESAKAM